VSFAAPLVIAWPPTISMPANDSDVLAVALLEIGTSAGALAMAAFPSGNPARMNHPVVTRVGVTVLSVRVPYPTTLFVMAPEALVNPPAIENCRVNWVHGGEQTV